LDDSNATASQCGLCSANDTARVGLPRDALKRVHPFTLVRIPRRQCTVDLAVCARVEGVEGDFVETGVFKGGMGMLMKMALDACVDGLPPPKGGAANLWLFDSFEGLPEDSGQLDLQFTHKVSKAHKMKMEFPDMVKRGNFRAGYEKFVADFGRVAFGDPERGAAFARGERGEVKVHKGWFNETLPTAPVEKISFLRLDGDVYSSTWDGLVNLYPKVVDGGYVYLDDYGSFAGCQRATDKYRAEHNISEPMHKVKELRKNRDGGVMYEAVWWKKGSRE